MKTQTAIRLFLVVAALTAVLSAGKYYGRQALEQINTTYVQPQPTKTSASAFKNDALILIVEEERIAYLFTHDHDDHGPHLFQFNKLRNKKYFPVTSVVLTKLLMAIIHVLMIASLLQVVH